ncbi:MAG: hypothetical protein ACKOA8_03935, partial [Deltaproteobacteria bacterium]
MSFLRLTFVYLISGAVPVGLAQDYTSPRGPLSEINSIQQLIQLVDDNRDLTTLEKVLHALPVPLRSSPVFIYRSESLQSASPEFPRVLLSDPSGNLVLAFNGESKQTGFDKLEALEFDEKKNRFNFYEMKFSSAGKLEVSKPNPSECLSCHRFSDPRPNWESYDQWPGVYGSNDDRLKSEEVEPFKNFLNLFELNPRYSALRIEPLKQVLGYSSHYGRLPNEPNISFTHRLSRNNFKRLARLIMESPDYEKFKYMIGGFLSSGEGERFSDIGYLPEKISSLTDYYSKENIREVEAIAISYANSVSNPATLTFRSLFEARGIDTSDWFMNFNGALTNSFVNGTPWEDQLLEALLEKDSELKSFLYEGSKTQLQEAK